ncbi:MAG: hypothetical protein R2746_02960 [Acidimicrobiales bacterium]
MFQPGVAPVIVRAELDRLDVGPAAPGSFERTGGLGGLVRARLDGVGSGWVALACGGRVAGLVPADDEVSLFLDPTVCGAEDTPDAWFVDADQILHPLRSTS